MVCLGVAYRYPVLLAAQRLGIEGSGAGGGSSPVRGCDPGVLPDAVERRQSLPVAGSSAAGQLLDDGPLSGAAARVHIPAAGGESVAAGAGPAHARSRDLASRSD